MEIKSKFQQAISGTKKFAGAVKQAGSSVKNNIGKRMSDVANTTKNIAEQTGEIGTKLAAVGAAVVGGIMNPLKGMVGLFALSLKYLTESEVRATATARATGLMGSNLKETSKTVSQLHERYRMFGEGIDGSIQTVTGLHNAMGNVDYATGKSADHITRFSLGAGIGKDTSAKILSTMMLTQGATEDTAIQAQNFAKDLSNAAGVPINLVMDDLANITDDVSGYLGSNPEELVKATIEARRLGLSLSATAKVADSLLDFESSIEKEMEAQILTGKTLNFDKARGLALQGDTVGAAKEMLSQVGGIGEFNKMNVIQQKSLAAATGMGLVELKKSLGVKDKEKDLEEKRADDMRNTQMDQAKGVKMIATTMEALNDRMHQMGKILAEIMRGPAEEFMAWISSDKGKKQITELVKKFVKFGKEVLPYVIDAAKWLMGVLGGKEAEAAEEKTSLITGAIRGIGSAMKWVIDKATAMHQQLGGIFSTIAKNMLTNIGSIFTKIKPLFGQTISAMFTKASTAVGKWGPKFLKVFKKLPIIGSLVSFGFAVSRFSKGDYVGAGMEIASGLANLANIVAPGVGSAASLAIDAGIVYRDVTTTESERTGGRSDQVDADFISRGGRTRRFRKDDLVIGGTKLDQALGRGGSESNQAILTALNNIASLLAQPGEVKLDGRLVGEALSMSKSYVQ